MEHQRWQPEDRQPFSLELQRPPQRLQCPRCESNDTKFCYYNNYSMTQPRYYCRTCKRFWTQGGALRNIPEGGRRKKAKTTKSSSLPRSPSSGKAPAVHSAEVNCQVPVFASAVGINAYYYGGAGNSSTLGGHLGDLHPGGTIPSNLSLNPEVMVPDFSLMRPLFDIHLQQYVQQLPEPHLTLHQNLMNNGGVLIQGQPHPAGWSMQQISAQQVVASFNNTPAMTELAPASAPTPTSAAATTETANWDSSSLEPSASPTPSSPPPPSPFAFM